MDGLDVMFSFFFMDALVLYLKKEINEMFVVKRTFARVLITLTQTNVTWYFWNYFIFLSSKG